MRACLVLLGAMAMTLTRARFSVGAEICGAAPKGLAEPPEVSFTGTVLETTNVSRYTYVQIDTGKEKIWAAGPVVAIKVGDSVSLGAGMPNKNFYSPTLKRKFDELCFVGAITPSGVAGHVGIPSLPPGHLALRTADAEASTNTAFEVIQKPAGGKTVAEIWTEKANLSGKQVVVRAKVVKVSPNIMGKTFLHLRDGTGREGENDLTATTKDLAKVGAVITASGIVTTGRDFGSGYKYDVIMEEVTVTTP